MTVIPTVERNRTARKVTYIPQMDEFYNKWSNVYDHDGNVLQQLDDYRFNQVLPKLMSELLPYSLDKKIRILDFGCGTGRNLIKLFGMQNETPDQTFVEQGEVWKEVDIVAMDISQGMMSKAQAKAAEVNQLPIRSTFQGRLSVTWLLHDIVSSLPIPQQAQNMNIIYSTLVLEHLPELSHFFKFARQSLASQHGKLFISNMHPDMGDSTSAGYYNPDTGEKIVGFSANYSIDTLIEQAKNHGFKLLERIEDSVQNTEHAQKLGPRAQKWVGIKMLVSLVFAISE